MFLQVFVYLMAGVMGGWISLEFMDRSASWEDTSAFSRCQWEPKNKELYWSKQSVTFDPARYFILNVSM